MEITVETTVKAPLHKVWEALTKAEHITGWNFASDDWHCPASEIDLRPGGRFRHRMEAKDGSMGFDMEGAFTRIDEQERMDFTLDDGRKVSVMCNLTPEGVHVTEIFEAENTFPPEQQKDGWQSILDSFRRYVERTQ